MQSEIKVGQRFKFNILSDNPAPERQAVVTRVLSNREEGMGPEVDYYFAYWVEAHELPATAAPTTSPCCSITESGPRWMLPSSRLTTRRLPRGKRGRRQ